MHRAAQVGGCKVEGGILRVKGVAGSGGEIMHESRLASARRPFQPSRDIVRDGESERAEIVGFNEPFRQRFGVRIARANRYAVIFPFDLQRAVNGCRCNLGPCDIIPCNGTSDCRVRYAEHCARLAAVAIAGAQRFENCFSLQHDVLPCPFRWA